MQLKGATKLELQLYRACLDNESQPASDKQTTMSVLLSEAANELQNDRRRGQLLLDACLAFHAWVEKHDHMLGNAEFLKLYDTICHAIGHGSGYGKDLPPVEPT